MAIALTSPEPMSGQESIASIVQSYELPEGLRDTIQRAAFEQCREEGIHTYSDQYDCVAELVERLTMPFNERFPTRLDDPVFTDTSFIETLVFSNRAGLEAGPNLRSWLSRKRYQTVFFLEALGDYEQSAVRMESDRVARHIGVQVEACYRDYSYEPVLVPTASVAERVAFVGSVLDGC